jgi:hypothetical protein
MKRSMSEPRSSTSTMVPVHPGDVPRGQIPAVALGDVGGEVVETELAGGGLRLSLSRATSPDQGLLAAREGPVREPARIITMAWGDRYIEDVLSLTLPALLAPGNLPAFVEHFDSEFVIVTETRFFDRIVCEPVISQLLRYCNVRLLPIDDLLSPHYGITLTYALVRGFADLGPAMVKTHLCFVCADFIIADGSYRKLAEMIRRGERLAVSPSYCMVLENTVEKLRARYDPATCSISIPRRELAALTLANRHNTIRAKTVNQRLFRIHRYDQLYWYVDDHTLLGRQLPIAVVYMRPERVITELPSFWDYGVITEVCPGATPCVLGDSDDFLMAELRTESTARELLHLGWPEIDEIVTDLSSYTTQEHHDYGRHTLVLHSRDLPPSLPSAKAAFSEFVDGIYRRLSPPISHVGHPFWDASFPIFQRLYAAQKRQLEEREKRKEAKHSGSDGAARRERLLALRQRLREVRLELSRRDVNTNSPREARIAQLEAEFRARRAAFEQEFRHGRAETISDSNDPLAEHRAELEREIARLATEAAGDPWEPCTEPVPTVDDAGGATPRGVGRLVQLYHRFFGQMPRTTPWNPYHAVLRHVNAVIAAFGRDSDVLIISSGGTFGPLLARGMGRRKVAITPTMAEKELYFEVLEDDRKFDLCICDLAFDDLLRFRSIFDTIRRHLRDGARVVVFHANGAQVRLDPWTFQFTVKLFPLSGRSIIRFSGSLPGAFALRWFERTLRRYSLSSLKGHVALALTLAICAPFALLANSLEKRRNSNVLPKHCTGFTIEIELV